MNATLLRRLFLAVEREPGRELLAICRNIADDERRLGHERVAQDLDKHLKRIEGSDAVGTTDGSRRGAFQTLPASKRTSAPLVQVVKRDRLRHFMILPDEIEARFTRIEKEYAARARLARHGLPAPKRILLYGPPGCGKSLGAERLAWSTGLPLHRVRLDTLISSYFGETASNLQQVFEGAHEHASALFLDECDTIAQSRGQRNDVGEISRVVNTLLQLMEDYRGEGLVIAATNVFESLDRALFRRFDECIQVPLPGQAEIARLLAVLLEAMSVANDVDNTSLAKRLDGLSCSEVERIAHKSAKRCIMSGRYVVSMDDLDSAAREVTRYT
jgi:ATP-dependent 26S proteasome regulatory subunit